MSKKPVQYSAFCPLCKKMINFELEESELKRKLHGGLAAFSLEVHGDPKHILTVYIDREGRIRGSYPSFEEIPIAPKKDTLQFNHIVDASSEIPILEGKFLGVEVVPYDVINDKKIRKAYMKEIYFSEVFNLLLEGHRIGTDPISVETFLQTYRELENDKPVIVITASSDLSKIYYNAVEAKKILEKEHPSPSRKFEIIDSLTVGPFLKLMSKTALEMDTKGRDLQEIKTVIDWLRNNHRSYVLVASLEYLRRSNRIGRLAGFFGNLLGIMPILGMNFEGKGHLKSYKSARSLDDGLSEIIKMAKEDFAGKEISGIIFHGMCEYDAIKFRELLESELSIDKNDFLIESVGSAIGIHTGLGSIGITIYPKL